MVMAGADHISDYREIRAIILLNAISLMASVVVAYFGVFYILTNNLIMLVSVLPIGLVMALVPVLNYFKKSTVSKFLIFTAGTFNIMLSVWWLGVGAEIQHYFYVMIVSVFVCFTQEQKYWKAYFLGLSGFFLFVVTLNPWGLFSGVQGLSEDILNIIAASSVLCSVLVVIAIGEVMSNIVQKLHFQSLQEKARKVELSRLEAINTLSGGVAHEINNPLAIISSTMDRMDKIDHSKEEDRLKEPELKKRVKIQVARISTIVKNLRSFSEKSENADWILISPAQLVDECIELCSAKLSKSDIATENLIDRNFTIVGSKAQLMQMIISMISNSIDGVKTLDSRWIKFDCTWDNQTWHLRITDSGEGIDPKIRDRIMQPFFTTREPGQGTGLGLTLATSIAEQH